MQFYVYRYIDSKTNEIMYIGKTNQPFVTTRIDQHKTDNVGIWANNNKHYIEFIELPREEDMNYIESYLIRKEKPILNIVLSTQDAPPFEILIKDSEWKNLKDFLQEQNEIKTLPNKIFAKNIVLIQESNKLFSETINDIINRLSLQDKNFIKKLCFSNDLNNPQFSISHLEFCKNYNITNILEINPICDRLISYTQKSRIEGTTTEINLVGIFNNYIINEKDILFFPNSYIKKFLERI